MAETTKRTTSLQTGATGKPMVPELTKALATDSDVQERISFRAYELYQKRGEKDGHDIDDWLQAEEEITGRAPTRGH